jgi:2-phospho-L-lactate guanylyltransferase
VRVIAVPVKALARAKTRLAPVLTPLERGSLTLAMLEDVLDATTAMPGWETWVVSADEAVLEIAARRRVRPLLEETPPLSAAVKQVEEESLGAGADALAVLLADVPLVTPRALGAALQTLGPVVLAPSEDEGGTNLLLRRPPKAVAARFGRDSFAKHRRAAETKGLPVAEVRAPELAFDLDTPEDLERILRSEADTRTRSVCRDLDVAARLGARA